MAGGTRRFADRLEWIGATKYANGSLIKAGTSALPVTSQVASTNFVQFYNKSTSATGDIRGIYNRLYLATAGVSGESLRSFTTVSNVAASTAHGAHLSLSFASTGTVTGLGVAARATLHIPNTTPLAGTLAAVQAEIWSDGTTSDPAGSLLSVFRVVNGGDATGAADVDTDAFFVDFAGWTPNNGAMISAVGNEPTWASKTYKIKSRLPSGTTVYFVAVID